VIEHAGAEADRSGQALPPYQGRATMTDGTEVHIYGGPDTADRARMLWAEQAHAEQL
jgi:hypothetical protein